MQKHQQWLDNKTYEHHLKCLIRIKQSKRKQQVKSASLGRSQKQSRAQESFPQRTSRRNNLKSKDNLPIKQRNLMWENFLLGKRIIETNPVITHKKHAQEYIKNRRIVQLRTKVCKKQPRSNFRESKLKQFEENTSRINEKFRVQTACKLRRIMAFKILQLDLFRIKTVPFDEIFIKYRFEGKPNFIKTQIVNYNILFDYTFYFTLSRHKKENTNMQIQIVEMRGLNETSIGNFCVDVGQISNREFKGRNQRVNFYRHGKLAGQLQYSYQIIKKKQIQKCF